LALSVNAPFEAAAALELLKLKALRGGGAAGSPRREKTPRLRDRLPPRRRRLTRRPRLRERRRPLLFERLRPLLRERPVWGDGCTDMLRERFRSEITVPPDGSIG
jgi:hypothetical protein